MDVAATKGKSDSYKSLLERFIFSNEKISPSSVEFSCFSMWKKILCGFCVPKNFSRAKIEVAELAQSVRNRKFSPHQDRATSNCNLVTKNRTVAFVVGPC